MSEWQYDEFSKYYFDSDLSSAFSIKPMQSSNIIFPISKKDDNYNGGIGESAYDSCFITNTNGKVKIRKFLQDIDGFNFLYRTNIGQFSIKFKNILESITHSQGIVFVYSQFLVHGVKTLALVLEANGFTRWNNKEDNFLVNKVDIENKFCSTHNKYYNELTNEERKTFTPAKYILLDGSVSKRTINTLLKEVNGLTDYKNTYGQHIKVVLGSPVVEQGLTIKNVREVHIVDPWHHFNQLTQAFG